jgi:hypothetical protein
MGKRKAGASKKKSKRPLKQQKKGCQHPGCSVRPSYGLEKGRPTHCATHALSEMWDVIHKTCAYDGCSVQPNYGLEKGRPTHCATHASSGMKNVVSKTCEHQGCSVQPSYGLKKGEATHCATHALPGMKNVVSKTCAYDGCSVIPTYGLEKGRPTHCATHASLGMWNVLNKTCEHQGCSVRPNYGLEKGKATHCATHALSEMWNVKSKTCAYDGCNVKPSYGMAKGKATHCAAHALSEMWDVLSKTCAYDGCSVIPTYGLEKGRPTHCATHASPSMWDVMHQICIHQDCKSRASYGTNLLGKVFCAKHKDIAQHWKVTTCSESRCKRTATHSETGQLPFVYCDNHAPQEYFSCIEQRCKKCGFELLCDEEQMCLVSCSSIHEGYVKRTENAMNDFFEKKSLTFTRDNAPAGSCTRRRPDFVFKTLYGVIIVENDENQHKSYVQDCEVNRMIELHQAFGEAVHFVRFNPDRFLQSATGKTGFVELATRHAAMFDILSRMLSNPQEFFVAFPSLSVRYLFYDNCDLREHFMAREIIY